MESEVKGGSTDVKGARDQGERPGEGSWRELRALQEKEGIHLGESICHMTARKAGGEGGTGLWVRVAGRAPMELGPDEGLECQPTLQGCTAEGQGEPLGSLSRA